MEVLAVIAIVVFGLMGLCVLTGLDNLVSAINSSHCKSRFMIGCEKRNLEPGMVYEILTYDEPTQSYILKKCPELIWHKEKPAKPQDSNPA